jgi:hypothetical protein
MLNEPVGAALMVYEHRLPAGGLTAQHVVQCFTCHIAVARQAVGVSFVARTPEIIGKDRLNLLNLLLDVEGQWPLAGLDDFRFAHYTTPNRCILKAFSIIRFIAMLSRALAIMARLHPHLFGVSIVP